MNHRALTGAADLGLCRAYALDGVYPQFAQSDLAC